ncbi:hypothetical protein FRB90_012413 [Tulasnella sp. 427]|nr:hypothetical protein FRB90_012413 [Tulasnella sp. 427]
MTPTIEHGERSACLRGPQTVHPAHFLSTETWITIYLFLQYHPGAWNNRKAVGKRVRPLDFGLVCKMFLQVRREAWKTIVEAQRLRFDAELVNELSQFHRPPEVVAFGVFGSTHAALEQLGCLERLTLTSVHLTFQTLQASAVKKSLKRLVLRQCVACLMAEDLPAICQLFGNSDLASLDLDHYMSLGPSLSVLYSALATIPSLKTLYLAPQIFRDIGDRFVNVPDRRLQSLWISRNYKGLTSSIKKAHLCSALTRCPDLEDLVIDRFVRSMALAQNEHPVQSPHLKSFEGCMDRALVYEYKWDRGAIISLLASRSTALKSLVVELIATMEDPVMKNIDQWVLSAAARWKEGWEAKSRFSLIPRVQPQSEWAYSAQAGISEEGEVFIQYFRRHAELEAYLSETLAGMTARDM